MPLCFPTWYSGFSNKKNAPWPSLRRRRSPEDVAHRVRNGKKLAGQKWTPPTGGHEGAMTETKREARRAISSEFGHE